MKFLYSLLYLSVSAQCQAVNLPQDEPLLELAESQARSITSNHVLDARQGARVQLAQGAVLAAGMFAYQAAGKCPYLAKEEDVNNTQCGIAATFSVLSAVFAVIEGAAAYRQRAQQPNSQRDVVQLSGFEADESWPGGLSLEDDTSLVDGLSVTLTPSMTSFDEAGHKWYHYDYRGHSTEHDATHIAQIRRQPDTNRTIVSSQVDDYITGGSTLGKRAVVYAHYSYVDGNAQNYNRARLMDSDVHRLAAKAWNFLHSNNIDRACMSPYDVLNPGRAYIERGEFALLAGAYRDQSSSCPEPRS